MNFEKEIYAPTCSFVNDFTLLSAELIGAVNLLGLLDDCAHEDGLADTATGIAISAAALYIRRIANEISELDERAEGLISKHHAYLNTVPQSALRGGE